MLNTTLIDWLEKIGKMMLLIPAIMGIAFILLIIYFELTGIICLSILIPRFLNS
ncbi:MAG: hypothetical protein ACPK85_12705 [Methanosarcina sp.]